MKFQIAIHGQILDKKNILNGDIILFGMMLIFPHQYLKALNTSSKYI